MAAVTNLSLSIKLYSYYKPAGYFSFVIEWTGERLLFLSINFLALIDRKDIVNHFIFQFLLPITIQTIKVLLYCYYSHFRIIQ